VQLFVREYLPETKTYSVPALCLHGLTRNSADFDGLAPAIAGAGRRVLALDMRGRGRSGRDPKPSRYRGDVYVADVIAVLDALAIPEAVFIGTSMGGIITMMLGSTAPERIRAAVLNDIGPIINLAGRDRIMGYVGKNVSYRSWAEAREATRAMQQPNFPPADDAFWERFVRRVARELPDGSVIFDYDPRIRDELVNPTGPPVDLAAGFAALAKKELLLVRGARSDILSADGVAAMRKVKPDLAYAEVPGVGHAPTLDEPEARDAILTFLLRLS
jgi:pimeloyl-ACP methyl ester carboxylesterase